MQTSKFLLAMGALAAVILPLQVQAGPDNAEQAKMREVLRRMMEQSNAPETGSVTKVAPPATSAPPQPVVVTVPKPVTAPIVPVAPPPTVITPKATQVIAVPATAVVVAPPAAAPTFETVPPPDDAASLARAREAMRQKMLELQATPATATVATTPVAPAPMVTPTPIAPVAVATPRGQAAPVFAPTYAPIQAPDSPLSGPKQAKLAELLVRYKADAITAQEYHVQRAAIIAEP